LDIKNQFENAQSQQRDVNGYQLDVQVSFYDKNYRKVILKEKIVTVHFRREAKHF